MKQAKKIISILLATIMTLSVFAAMPMTVSAAAPTIDDYDKSWYDAANAVKGSGQTGATNESIAIDDIYDLFAFNKLCQADSGNVTYINVHLTADIDMTGVEWPMAKVEYAGTFDGRGFSIKNLDNAVNEDRTDTQYKGSFFDYLHGGGILKDIKFVDMDVKGGAFSSLIARATAGVARLENVYVQGSINGTAHATSGMVGQVANGTLTFVNCVCDVTVTTKGYGAGFVSTPNAAANIIFEDCAFTGEIICSGSDATYDSTGCAAFICAIGGGGATAAPNVTFTRCMSWGDSDAKSDWYAPLFYIINGKNTSSATINVNDCYVASANGSVVNSKHGNTNYTVNFTFNGKTAYTVSGAKVSDKISEINAAFAENGGYISNGETINITADNFGKMCPAVAQSGNWVVTDETILPKTVAEMINAPIKEAPNATEYLQVRTTSAGYDMQFTGAVNVDDLNDYASVGFDVVVKIQDGATLMTETVKTQSVYTSIVADGADVSASTLGADYLNVLQIKGFKSGNVYEISILSFAEKADGTVVYDYNGALNVTVQNGALVD